MSRSHSHSKDNHYSHRNTKHSQPDSPNPTLPSSSTFSSNSLPPTRDHTPLATPIHSPRPCGSGYNLPAIRDHLQPRSTLTPIKSQHIDEQYHTNNQATSTPQPRSVISDIMSRTDGAKRILPPLPAPTHAKEIAAQSKSPTLE